MKKEKSNLNGENIAAIDIGSNATRLMIKKVSIKDDQVSTREQLFVRVPIRLGFDVFDNGKISATNCKKMERLMKAFNQLMKVYDVKKYRACATSAMRDSKNGDDLIDDVYEDCGLDIDIISGEEEAKIIYNNHFEQIGKNDENYLYTDVGGGSTEINLVVNGKLMCSCSYNIGTVRMLQDAECEKRLKDLQEDLKKLRDGVLAGEDGKNPLHIIGSGGNINKLYRLLGKKKKDRSMSIEDLRSMYVNLSSLSVEERMETYNLKSDRADVIVPAAKIFLTIAEAIEAKDIQVPVIGLCDGIIDTIITEKISGESKDKKKK